MIHPRMVALALMALTARAAADDFGAELRLRGEARRTNDAGPLAGANALAPGLAPSVASNGVAQAELHATWRAPALQSVRASLTGNALLSAERRRPTGDGAPATNHEQARFNEAFAAGDFGTWQASAGKKIVAWDVGYAFRPNDVVQQEARRSLLSLTQEGRPVVEIERFGAESAGALVWVNPHHAHAARDAQRGAQESALAARAYVRSGSADWHAFGRWGRFTRASAGAALAWVATDELELHSSARVLQRHDAWQFDASAAAAPVSANPWRQTTLGGAAQGLLGASWTGAQNISLLAEWWYDGTALADREWQAWGERNRALAGLGGQPGLPPGIVRAVAGNLAWQATPYAASNLRRNNAFVRLAWQPPRWVLSIDALLTPSDAGRVFTAAVSWQGEQVRVNAAWRIYAGPGDAVLAQLPQRQAGALSVTWPF